MSGQEKGRVSIMSTALAVSPLIGTALAVLPACTQSALHERLGASRHPTVPPTGAGEVVGRGISRVARRGS